MSIHPDKSAVAFALDNITKNAPYLEHDPSPFEDAATALVLAWCQYADAFHDVDCKRSRVGEVYILGEAWLDIGRALIDVARGPIGRLNPTTLDALIREIAMTHADVNDQLESNLCDRCGRERKLPDALYCAPCAEIAIDQLKFPVPSAVVDAPPPDANNRCCYCGEPGTDSLCNDCRRWQDPRSRNGGGDGE